MGSAPAIACFMYHEVTDDPRSSGFQRSGALPYKHSRRAFAQHLAELATSPLVPELIGDIDLTRAGRHLLLTFDDGGKSALHVSEELSRRGWKGHFFIVTSLIGTRTFLDAGEIKRIRSCGHVIGSHSHTHPNIFKDQPLDRMVEEWRVSSDRLAQLLGEPCVTASVPGGDISHQVPVSASAAGLRYLFTSEPWLTPRNVGGCWMVGRFSAKVGTSPARVRELAHFRGWTGALVRRRLKVLVTGGLPSLYRLYVRTRTREWQDGE